MSVSSLHHCFKNATTITPMQYLKRLRLHRARQLLSSDLSAAGSAAYAVGYNSAAQFSRDFKLQFGVTPSDFMRRMRNELGVAG